MKKLWLLAVAAASAGAVAACDAPPTLTTPVDGPRFHHEQGGASVDLTAPDAVPAPGYVTANATLVSGSGSWRYSWYIRRCTDADMYACSPAWSLIADGTDVKSVSQYVSASDWWVEFLVQVRDVHGQVVSSDIHTVTGARGNVLPVDAYITGLGYVDVPGNYQYDAVASGGDGTFSYDWTKSLDGGFTWNPVGYGGSSVWLCIQPRYNYLEPTSPDVYIDRADMYYEPSNYWINLRVNVSSAGQTVTAYRDVQVSLPANNNYLVDCLE